MQNLGSELVLDASAFYAGIAFLAGTKSVTTTAVFAEVAHIKGGRLDALIHSGNLKLFDPDPGSIEKVTSVATMTGDITKLSSQDISVLALALERNAILASDDYAVANVAANLGVKVAASSAKGIKETRQYITYCSACSKTFSPLEKECPLCGNILKRRSKKKKQVTK